MREMREREREREMRERGGRERGREGERERGREGERERGREGERERGRERKRKRVYQLNRKTAPNRQTLGVDCFVTRKTCTDNNTNFNFFNYQPRATINWLTLFLAIRQ